MKMILSAMLMVSIIVSIMILTLNLVSKKSIMDREKSSPFECGFDPKNSARLPFSLQFFLLAIIFIIFDVELTLFLPMISSVKCSSFMTLSVTMTLFVMILIIGIFHEQKEGSLNWFF
uniref:NADH-ubiquinone oxidoreductase chain 3 n=1 Tax=Phloeosinus perlatus TaxID=2800998 RepID=A0A891GU80_9CUCU|nr:NADH dehydrogenase subunit 3 [Phloeosinus perlatus]QRK25830.1 NADH dehydrogenase subunit 3 [Phloeosinus perlatus]